MFADRAKIYIRSGKGGDGHVSFRRELFVPSGGPDGGDGGRGGDVIFEVDKGLNALSDYRHKRKYAAGDGEPGGKRRCHGADGKDIILKVPEGTVIKDAASGKVIADMSGGKHKAGSLKRRKRRQRQSALRYSHHAGPEICPAGTGCPGAGGTVRAESDRGRGPSGIPQCWKIHSSFQSEQCPASDRQLSFHYHKPSSGRGGF